MASKGSRFKRPQVDVRNQIIFNMCMKQRHDFALRLTVEDKLACPLTSGMTQLEADYLMRQMTELYEVVMEGLAR